ncbi:MULTISPECIES: DUF4342 domain-containing protein [Clostridium]|uniref:Nascent polypeptide-associated complex protein n=1 Tax=Clostridium butyricum TaxID=1492 RepID=A0A6N3AU92_CLOBU|nr:MULTISPECIES: DUF4342 domain-containing protein [Clostridium]MCQ2014109.1 DUF4342 domain-containing protein [Clostridium butyricum]MCQ2026199.1 DUF4342 domain-containing protein [Clostridium butyricum]MDB2136537.1 DUF4342 domain-containing protein [Clostridium butyricum]MDI9207711.1 DUF4342 domain-containing protein [Clostridium butyricum]MDU0324787.1 DUF4342 domain-containing protein [Clostridium butyricum]
MENITLEQVDVVRERCNVSYAQAKEALEACNGDVLEAIIYIEQNQKKENENSETKENEYAFNAISMEELKNLIKGLIEKGNVTRIKIKKDDKEILDIPVNAGIAASVIAITIPPILAAVVIAAIATQITIEVTKEDGSVEVINKYVTQVANDVKNKASDLADVVKNKVNDVKTEVKSSKDEDGKTFTGGETIYTYTVDFEEEKKNNSDEN